MTGCIKSARSFLRRTAAPAAASILALAAVAPAAGQTAPAQEAALAQYRVNVGDELDVFVWGEERMQRSVRVQPDGTFAFPLAGTIKAVGRSVTDISSEIRERISVNYRAAVPDVTVSVRDASAMRFYVIGKVRTPGSYTSGTPINILQALSMAGGTAEFADVKNAVILRQRPDGTQLVEPVQLRTLLKGRRGLQSGSLASLPTLKGGDVLVVP